VNSQLVIPMSGLGERFQRAGYQLPKPLIPVDGKPIIAHVLDMYPGWDDVVFIVNEEHLDVKSWNLERTLKELRPEGNIVPIAKHKKGPAWAVKQATQYIDRSKPVVANYCDFTCRWNHEEFEKKLNSGLDGLIPTYTGFHPHMLRSTAFAYVKKEGNRVVDIQEKQPWTVDPFSEEASSGTYAFGSGQIMLDAIDEQIEADDSLNNEFYLSLTYKSMLKRGMNVETFLIDYFMQWGTPEDLQDYEYWSETFKKLSTSKISKIDKFESLLLAAGEGRRFADQGYLLPKPLIEVSGSPMVGQVAKGLGTSQVSVLSRSDLPNVDQLDAFLKENNFQILHVDAVTSGQAESALLGLQQMNSHDENKPIFIGSCDALMIPDNELDNLEIAQNEIWVWSQQNYRPGAINPMAYGWVKSESNSDLLVESAVKTLTSISEQWQVITGTFTFGDKNSAESLLKEFLESGERVNGESYLDSLLDFALQRKWIVRIKHPDFFVSLGTPEELTTFNYWQKCMDSWPSHPYSVECDPFCEENSQFRNKT
jgi:NDP-sugar pyrophosphorylase family protein